MPTDLTRWEPMKELGTLREEMERAFRHTFGPQPDDAPLAGVWSPSLDVEETDSAFEVYVEAPGVKPDDIEITLEEGVLSISGEREFYDDKDQEGFRRVERRFGRFRRSLRLPTPVDPEKVEASYTDGILSVTVPKAEAAKPRKINIKTS